MSRLGLFIRIFPYPDEVERFNILLTSLRCHAPWDDLQEIIIVSSDQRQQDQVQLIMNESFKMISKKTQWFLEEDSLVLSSDNYLYLEADTVNVKPWPVKAVLSSVNTNGSPCSVQCYSRANLRIKDYCSGTSLTNLVTVVNSPQAIFEGKSKSDCPFLIYPRSSQLCPDLIYDLVRTHLGQALSNDLPLISCLMVTKDRLNYVKLAIRWFQDQTYPQKELVIISDSSDGVKEYLEILRDDRIRLIRPSQDNLTLGQLRNFSLNQARGKYVCQWDDDDFYHPSRLSLQYQALVKAKADLCMLSQWMLISPRTGQYGISASRKEGWEGSMLALKSVLPEYPSLKRGEDRQLIQSMTKQKNILVIDQPGYWMLYGYLIHQNNTWSEQHFQNILVQRIPLSVPWPKKHQSIARYLAQRHLFEYQGYQEESLPVVSMLIHRINGLWQLIY